jgi:hypothetical protein
MSFLNPLYLWALLGLAIPIAIHLWSKKEGKTIKIGSIKLLSDEDSRQSSSISINELLLLFLRLSLISLIVLILAEPQIERENSNTPITFIVEPSLLKNNEIATLIDSLTKDSDIRLLQNEFPELSDNALLESDYSVPNYWQLAHKMEALHTDSIVVFTKAFATGIKGKRPSINKNIEWIILNSGESVDEVIEATRKKDQVELLSVLSNSGNLSFKKQNITLNSALVELNITGDSIVLNPKKNEQKLPLTTEDPLKVLLCSNPERIDEATYIEASLSAISKHLIRPIDLTKTQDLAIANMSDFSYTIWLSDASVPRSSGRILKYRPDPLALNLIIEGDTNNEFLLTKPLNAENIFDAHLTEELVSWLNLHPDLSKNIKHFDKRIVDKSELRPLYNRSETDSNYIETLSISKWLWIILALLLVVERIVASYRKQ